MTQRNQLNEDLYRKAYLVRAAEEKIRKHYLEDEMKTPVHLSVGEEAIVSGVCHALTSSDKIFGTYRGHGIYLALTGETDKFFAELFGKQTGIAKGKSGSMHLFSIEHGFLGSSAIVGASIPAAVGASFAMKFKKKCGVVAVFFGDGAIEEGAFWESLNVSCLMKLPVLFVYEDNGLAIHSHIKNRQSFQSIADVLSQFPCHVFQEETTDPEIIYQLTRHAIDKIKTHQRPSLIHVKYYRYYEHVGIHPDFKFGYRSEDEFRQWFKKDPIHLQRNKLISLGISEERILEIENKIHRQIERSFSMAKEAPFPAEGELYQDVYA